MTTRIDIWFHRYENGRDIEGRFDYNSWVESDKGRKLAATLDKDVVLAEGYKEYETGRTYMARMGDWRNNKDEEIELDGIGGVNILVKADVHRSGKFAQLPLVLFIRADCDQASTSPPTHSRIKPRLKALRRWLREPDTKSSDYRTMLSGISTRWRSQETLEKLCIPLWVYNMVDGPRASDLYYWSVRILHLSKRCEGQYRQGSSAEEASNAQHISCLFGGTATLLAFGAL